MMKNLLLLLALLVLHSCASTKFNTNKVSTSTIPPNGFQTDENFYVDKTEISNHNWAEYSFWVKRVYGDESAEYSASLPDTTVWLGVVENDSILMKSYYRDIKYRHFPVVGVSQKQANAYSKWRSDRVFEWILINNNVIQPNPNQNRSNYFTTERFLASEASGSNKKVSFYPDFRLPTVKERIKIEGVLEGNIKENFEEACNKKGIVFSNTKATNGVFQSLYGCPLRPVKEGCVDKQNPILNLKGNVSEWGKERATSFGGGWNNDEVDDPIKVDNPNAWTGFRNVCEWVKIDSSDM